VSCQRRQRSGNFGCYRRSRGKIWAHDDWGKAGVFLSGDDIYLDKLPSVDFHQIWQRQLNSCHLEHIGKDFQKFSIYGPFACKNLKIEGVIYRHLTQTSLQLRRCTVDCRYTVYSMLSSMGRAVSEIGQLFCRRIVSELRHQISTIFVFLPIFPTKKTKSHFLVSSLQPMSYITEHFPLFHVVVEGPSGCLLLMGFSCDVWWESWAPQSPKLPKFRLWEIRVTIHRGASGLN